MPSICYEFYAGTTPQTPYASGTYLLAFLACKSSAFDTEFKDNFFKVTAEQLFIKKLPIHAKDWMKSTVLNCSIAVVLSATVAFAAAYDTFSQSGRKTTHPPKHHL
ncbi:hypothetical protein Tco_1063565 [Tanacetum coccineum]